MDLEGRGADASDSMTGVVLGCSHKAASCDAGIQFEIGHVRSSPGGVKLDGVSFLLSGFAYF